jgi:hypothetical protein
VIGGEIYYPESGDWIRVTNRLYDEFGKPVQVVGEVVAGPHKDHWYAIGTALAARVLEV